MKMKKKYQSSLKIIVSKVAVTLINKSECMFTKTLIGCSICILRKHTRKSIFAIIANAVFSL